MLHNFRDLGGLTTKCDRSVKHGQLFRTGNLSHVQTEIAEHLVEQKGIRVYIDFRSTFEIGHYGAPDTLIAKKIEWIHLPIDTDDQDFHKLMRPEPTDWLGLYHRLFDKNAEAWLKFLQIVAEADAPITYGCLFGKDRTGIASSILLETLNVRDEMIAQDYAETEKHIEPLYHRFRDLWKDRALEEDEIFKHYMQTPAPLMGQFLTYVRRHAVAKESKLLLEHLPYDSKTKLQLRLLQDEKTFT